MKTAGKRRSFGIRTVIGGATVCASLLTTSAFPQNFDVDSIFLSPAFKQKSLSGIPYLLEEKEYYKLEDGTLYKVQRQAKGKDKKKAVIEATAEGKAQRFLFNADYSRVLLLSDIRPIYRRSATCKAVLWSLDAKGHFSEPWVVDTLMQEPLFSPDGKKLAFLRQGNLYVADLQSREIYAITTDGKENEIRNGHTDWVYEEEFGFTRAFDWAGDSKALAWLKFDETALKQYDMTVWG
ncbi:MAG: DPP IV N-terminal domain-containing protein, partial [Bacteroidales bacterium]|nr:DPP IV N-terminal domain-containing protein [Bacteroidales bacterium]